MEVILRPRKKRVKKKIERDHYWYDPDTQQRLHGRGGKMIFVYDRATKKTVPRIVDSEEWVQEDSYDDIIKWAEDNGVAIVDKAPGHFVLIDVNAIEWSDIERNLYENRIAYDYDEQQLRRESFAKEERKGWQNLPSKWQIHQRP